MAAAAVSAQFTPVRQARASGEIVSQIERAIFSGQLGPGDRLQSERELAEQFSVSRITVRDALRVLEARGLIRVRVGASGGAFVAETSSDRVAESISTMIRLRRMTMSEIAEARTIVETATAELAAQRATPTMIQRLEAAVDRGRTLMKERQSHLTASFEFHVGVAQAAGNEVLAATVAAYHELIFEVLRGMREERSSRSTQRWHQVILEAVRAHDPDAAGRAMAEHMAESEKRLRAWLRAQHPEQKRAPRAASAKR